MPGDPGRDSGADARAGLPLTLTLQDPAKANRNTGATWVFSGMFPEMSTVAPNSLIARAKASAVPAAIA